eukprot:tig00021432_g21206.t1
MRDIYATLKPRTSEGSSGGDDSSRSLDGSKKTVGRLTSPFLESAPTQEAPSAAAGTRKLFRVEAGGAEERVESPASTRNQPSRNIAAFAATLSKQFEESAISSRGKGDRSVPVVGGVQVLPVVGGPQVMPAENRLDPRASLSTTTSSDGELQYSASRNAIRGSAEHASEIPEGVLEEGDLLAVTVLDAIGLPSRPGSTTWVSIRYGRQEAQTREAAAAGASSAWGETHRFEVADAMDVLNLVVQQREQYGRLESYLGEVNTRVADLRALAPREEYFPLVSRRPGRMPQGEIRLRLAVDKRLRPERSPSPPLGAGRFSGRAGLETVVEENSAAPSLQQSPVKAAQRTPQARRAAGSSRLYINVLEARLPSPAALHGRDLVCAVRYGAQEARTGAAPPSAPSWNRSFAFDADEGADMVTARLVAREGATGAEAVAGEARVPLLGVSAGDVLEDWYLLVSRRPGERLGGELRLRIELRNEGEGAREAADLERLAASIQARGLLTPSSTLLATPSSARNRYADPVASPAGAGQPSMARLVLTVKEARGLAARASGGGRPVPYAVARVGSVEVRTAPAPASFSPAWDQDLRLDLAAAGVQPGRGETLTVAIMDRDAMGPPSADACLGEALVSLDGIPLDGFTVDRWYPVTLAGGRRQAGELRLALRAERGPGPLPSSSPHARTSSTVSTPSSAPAAGTPASAHRYAPRPDGGYPAASLASRLDAGPTRRPGRRGAPPRAPLRGASPGRRAASPSAARPLPSSASGPHPSSSAPSPPSPVCARGARPPSQPPPPPGGGPASVAARQERAGTPGPAPGATASGSGAGSVAREQPLRRGAMVYLTVVEACEVAGRDLNGKSDPYAVVYLGSTKVQASHVVAASTEPVWGFACALDVRDADETITVVVMNRNRLLRDDYLGEVSLPLSRLRAGAPPLDGWFQLVSTKPGSKVSGQLHLKVYCINPGAAAPAERDPAAPPRPRRLSAPRRLAEGAAGGRLRITIGEARNLARREGAGAREPVCVIRYMGEEQRVGLGKGAAERAVEVRDVTAPVGFFVFEGEGLTGDEYIGEVLVQPSSVMQGGPSEAWFRLLANGRPGAEGRLAGQLNIRFLYEPPGAGPDAPLKQLQPALGRREGESALHEIARELSALFETLKEFPGGRTSPVVHERLAALDEKIARLALFLDKERRRRPGAPGGPAPGPLVREARGLAARDASGLADAYATVRCGHAEHATPVHWETSHPVWNWSAWFEAAADLRPAAGLLADLQLARGASVGLEAAAGDRVHVTLFDKDKIGSDDYLGEVTIPLREVATAGGSLERWFPVSSSRPSAAVRGELLCKADELLELRRCVGVLREQAEAAAEQLAAARSDLDARESVTDNARIRTELEARGLREELAAAREELARTRLELEGAREREAATQRRAAAREAAMERELREAAATRQSLPVLAQDAELRLREAGERARRAEERCQRLQQFCSELQAERAELQRQCHRLKEDVESGRGGAARAQAAEGELRRRLAQHENEIQIYRNFIERKLGAGASTSARPGPLPSASPAPTPAPGAGPLGPAPSPLPSAGALSRLSGGALELLAVPASGAQLHDAAARGASRRLS